MGGEKSEKERGGEVENKMRGKRAVTAKMTVLTKITKKIDPNGQNDHFWSLLYYFCVTISQKIVAQKSSIATAKNDRFGQNRPFWPILPPKSAK